MNETPINGDVPNAMETIASQLDGMKLPTFKMGENEYSRAPDGSVRRITPKKGEQKAPVNWRDRAIHAEKAFLSLLDERKKLQNLLLEACLKLEKYGFECEAGPLNNCSEFLEMKHFAKGVPHIHRPPLETMALNGKRCVKRQIEHPEELYCEMYLECGHVLKYNFAESKRVAMNDLLCCPTCTEVLKERGMYQEDATPCES